MKVDAKDIFEAFQMMKTFKSPEKTSRKTPEKKEKNFFEAFQEFKAQHDAFDQWKKDQEKLNKKEEKKEEKKGLSTNEWMMLLLGTFPITGPLYVYYVTKLFNIHW